MSDSDTDRSSAEEREDKDIDNSSNDKNCNKSLSPPKKKRKRLCAFNPSWETDYNWCRKVPGDKFKARCTACDKVFSVGHGGLHDVTQHSKTPTHTGAVSAARSASVRGYFVRTSPTGVDKQVGNVMNDVSQ